MSDDRPLHEIPAGTTAWYRAWRELLMVRERRLQEEKQQDQGLPDLHGEHLRGERDRGGDRGDDLGVCEQGLSEDDAD